MEENDKVGRYERVLEKWSLCNMSDNSTEIYQIYLIDTVVLVRFSQITIRFKHS
jgi:hypothetical protein